MWKLKIYYVKRFQIETNLLANKKFNFHSDHKQVLILNWSPLKKQPSSKRSKFLESEKKKRKLEYDFDMPASMFKRLESRW